MQPLASPEADKRQAARKGLNMEQAMENDTRYPYTYACDFLRGLAGYGEGGTKLSRADASQVRQGVADALGMPDDELARKLADYYKANQDALTRKSCEAFARSQAWPNPTKI